MTRARLRRYFRHGFFPQLIAFEACVRHGSVTRAAEELSLAQPTVSCLVRKLSETVGAPVLESRARRIEATALGHELLGLCEELFHAFDRFDERRAAAFVDVADGSRALPPQILSRATARVTATQSGVRVTLDLPELPPEVSSRR